MSVTTISSIEECINLLNLVMKSDDNNSPDYQFDDSWVRFELKIHEGDKHSIISSDMMIAFLAYESRIRHAYALAKYGDPTARLSEDDKKTLAIEVRVNDGCTEHILENTTKLLNALKGALAEMTVGMTGKQKTALWLSVAALTAGAFAWNDYVHLVEIEGKTEIATAKEETTRQVVRDALIFADPSRTLLNDTEKFEKSLNRGLKNADKVSVSGREIIAPKVTTKRETKELRHEQLNADYEIKNLDFQKDFARVKVENTETGLTFFATISSIINQSDVRATLLDNAIEHTAIHLSINATFSGDDLRSADIVEVHIEE